MPTTSLYDNYSIDQESQVTRLYDDNPHDTVSQDVTLDVVKDEKGGESFEFEATLQFVRKGSLVQYDFSAFNYKLSSEADEAYRARTKAEILAEREALHRLVAAVNNFAQHFETAVQDYI